MSEGEEKLTFKMWAEALEGLMNRPTPRYIFYLHPSWWKTPEDRALAIKVASRFPFDAILLTHNIGSKPAYDGEVWTHKDGILYPKEEHDATE